MRQTMSALKKKKKAEEKHAIEIPKTRNMLAKQKTKIISKQPKHIEN